MRSDRYSRILAGALALALVGCMDDPTEPATSFTATLTSAQEVPPLTNAGSGSATCSGDGTNFSCTITYSGLSGAPTAAHIHIGNAGVAGSVRVNLCGAGTAPACPTTAAGTITSGAQAPTGGTYAETLTSMQGFGAYVNIHTAANTGGEIRGQLFGVY